jgi:hypothetical protein
MTRHVEMMAVSRRCSICYEPGRRRVHRAVHFHDRQNFAATLRFFVSVLILVYFFRIRIFESRHYHGTEGRQLEKIVIR